jgi:hypothetical protein
LKLTDRLQKHWLGGVASLAAVCVSATWAVLNEVSVKPRDFRISDQQTTITQLKERMQELERHSKDLGRGGDERLEPTWVNVDRAMPALGGKVLIRLERADAFLHEADIALTLTDVQSVHWRRTVAGERKVFSMASQTYLFDILQVSQNSALVAIAPRP